MSAADLQQAVAATREQIERVVRLADGQATKPRQVYELRGDIELAVLPRQCDLIAAGLDGSLSERDLSEDDGADPAKDAVRTRICLAEAARTAGQSCQWLDLMQSCMARTCARQ